MKLNKKQSGSALLLALMTLALISGITASMLSTVQEEISIADRMHSQSLSQQQLLGGEAWAEYWLIHDGTANQITLPASRQLTYQTFKTDYGELDIAITDLQSCINVNLLNNAALREITRQRLQTLSSNMGIDPGWVDVMTDWVDNNQSVTQGQGKEDGYYLNKINRYRTGDTPLLADPEWRLLAIPKASLQALAPYLCALPDTESRININRAPRAILKAYLPDFTTKQMNKLTKKIGSGGYDEINDFLHDSDFQAANPIDLDWRVDTRFVSVSVTFHRQGKDYFLQSQLSKDDDTEKVISYYRAFAPVETLSDISSDD